MKIFLMAGCWKSGLALKGKDKVSGKEIVWKEPGIKCLERDSLVI